MILLPQLLAHGTNWYVPYILPAVGIVLMVLEDDVIMMRG